MGDESIEAMHAFAEAVQRAGEIIAEALRPVIEAFMETCRELCAWFYDRYTKAGAIYGDTDEGMLRWWQEVLTIARLRREAEIIEWRHGTLMEMRR